MFNFQARQIFVTQPRNSGGGILAFLLSLDSKTASLNCQQQTLEQKINDWNSFISQRRNNAHVHGFNNVNQPIYWENIKNADCCERYIHKHHFYELFDHDKILWTAMSQKQSIGIYLTELCVEKLLRLRPHTPPIDHYQLWIYSNQQKLMKDFFSTECRHVLPFSDMLDLDRFVDHLSYCKEIFDLDTDLTLYQHVIQQWYANLT